MVRTSRKPWRAPAREIVLYRDDGGWRYSIAYESDVADGRLTVQCETLAEAQVAVLAHVEEVTRFRYSAKWRSDKPGWWIATLALL